MFTKTILLPVIVLLINAPAYSQAAQPGENPVPKAEPSLPSTAETSAPVADPNPKPIAPKAEQAIKLMEKLPPGYEGAVKAFDEKKYPSATMQFEKFIKGGANDEKIHNYLAQCYYRQKSYSKAIKEYEWIAKNGKDSISLQNSAAKMARTLKCYMGGLCSENCLKANDPRWHTDPTHPGLWMDFEFR